MKVLGYHISDRGTVNSDGEVPNSLSLVEYLLQPKDSTIRVFYDLSYSIGFLLTSLKFTTKELKVLREETKFRLPPYHFRYVPEKFLSIKRATAFSYFSNASQYLKYPISDLSLTPLTLANRAKNTGELVRNILNGLGIEVVSLTSPARAYEKSQVNLLFKEMQKSADEVRKNIIDSIGLEVFGRTWENICERGSLNGTYEA